MANLGRGSSALIGLAYTTNRRAPVDSDPATIKHDEDVCRCSSSSPADGLTKCWKRLCFPPTVLDGAGSAKPINQFGAENHQLVRPGRDPVSGGSQFPFPGGFEEGPVQPVVWCGALGASFSAVVNECVVPDD
uniref:Uncharacterized protein n=1 Tax=Anopheles coluzzii TaxID=1518534 RepID=A0A8W7P839_ANOCL